MKRLIELTALLLVIVAMPRSATADEFRTSDFLTNCSTADRDLSSNPVESLQQMRCTFYLQGLMDAYSVAVQARGAPKFFCPPSIGISLDENVRIVRRYAKAHTDLADVPLRTVALAAYRNEFPCE